VERPEASAGVESRKGSRTWLLAGVLVVVCLVAALPFYADAMSAGRVPHEEDTAAAVAAVRNDFEDGDAVWVEPSWWVVPRHALERMGAGTDAWPFPALLVHEDFDPVEAYGYKRLFILAGFGREPSLPPELDEAGFANTVVQLSETTAVARYEVGPSLRLRTLTKEWTKLEVARRYAPEEKWSPCPFKADKHRCGRESWLDVALEGRVVWRREVNWLFVHPGPPGSQLEVAWPRLQRESGSGPTWLYVRIGLTLEAVRHPEGKAVAVEVLIDEREVDRFELEPRRFWMERRAIKMPPGTDPARVSIRIGSEEPAWRETVLEADVLTELPVPLRNWATNVIE